MIRQRASLISSSRQKDLLGTMKHGLGLFDLIDRGLFASPSSHPSGKNGVTYRRNALEACCFLSLRWEGLWRIHLELNISLALKLRKQQACQPNLTSNKRGIWEKYDEQNRGLQVHFLSIYRTGKAKSSIGIAWFTGGD